MLKIIKFELTKHIKRKENFIILFMFLIPLLYSIGVSNNSSVITYNSNEAVNGLAFANSMYAFVYMAFIFYLILAINSSNILRGEIDDGSMSIMLTRINNRKKIYTAKLYEQIIYWAIMTFLFIIFSLACYYVFISKLDISDGKLIGTNWVHDLLAIIAIYSSYILVISMVQSISMYFKSFVSIGIFIVVWVIFLYFKEFPEVKIISPIYYLECLIDSRGFLDFIKFMLLNWGLVSIFSFIGSRKFSRSDI